MADKKKLHQDRIQSLIKEVESLAKGLRSNLRKRADVSNVLKEVQSAANRLRRQAASTAGHVEKYVHGLRKELEGGVKKKRAKKKTSTKRSRKSAKKTTKPAS